jgi:hypothetical protein
MQKATAETASDGGIIKYPEEGVRPDSKGGDVMATVPVKGNEAPQLAESVEERLRRLEATWVGEVGHLSSSTAKMKHPAFQEILGMGPVVVPLMLRDLAKEPRLWVWALPKITGADPVPEADRGNIARMSEAWLRWGRENGYQWES